MANRPEDVQRLIAEEPFVRALAHSLVAGDADDVVQQAYLQALAHRSAALKHPRAWLAHIVRNLVADLRRRAQRREARDRAAARGGRVPSSIELLEGEERRRALVEAVDRLPPDQRTAVLLRYYDGLPPRRIAAVLGVPVATVWNRLHGALRTLRMQLDRQHGGRRAWLVPLVPFATSPRSLPWRELTVPAKTLCLGAIAMTTQTKIVAALAGVVALAVAWFGWPDREAPGRLPQSATPPGQEAIVAQAGRERGAGATAPVEAPARAAVATSSPPPATTGSLLVHVRYADEPTAAAGLTVSVLRPGGACRVGIPCAVTDAGGTARFEGLRPGAVRACTNVRPTLAVAAEIAAGTTVECRLELHGGMTLKGLVVDPAGVPVGGAFVEASAVDPGQLAVTSSDGTFTVRECELICLVGARAPGFAASQLHHRYGKPGGVEQVRIELRPDGGAVEGVVIDPTGLPVADAMVRVGEGNTDSLRSTPHGAPPLPAQVRTDGNGRFVAIGVPAGRQPLQALAAGLAPWRGKCEVAAGATTTARIDLAAGLSCTGIVRGEDGQPAAGVNVGVGERGAFVQLRTRTAADGTFSLHGLPLACVVTAGKEPLGKASATLRGQPGAAVHCEMQLSNGLVLRGRIVDDAGAPVAQAQIRCEADGSGPHWTSSAISGMDGKFLVAECPPARPLTVRALAKDHLPLQRRAEPGGAEIELRLARDTAPRARITGKVLRPGGLPAAGETVEASQPPPGPQLHAAAEVSADGSFTIEVAAGAWRGRIRANGHPEIRIETLVLDPGAVRDLGVLQLTIGGTLVVRDGGVKLDYLVLDARERFVCGLYTPVPPLRSELLAPGEFVLLARGEGVAAQRLPFTIRAEQQTQLEVPRASGVRQRIEFAAPAGKEPLRYVPFQLRADGKVLAVLSALAEHGGPPTCTIWLAPGAYSLATRDREPETTAALTIGATEGAPWRIALR